MDFRKQKPIYLQIVDRMSERIVAGEWSEDERVPSVREVAAELGVNPNTVMRTFEYLQNAEIIYNRRGMG
jgi:DNA-binding transcriptional regulator YhcF (GntR family)